MIRAAVARPGSPASRRVVIRRMVVAGVWKSGVGPVDGVGAVVQKVPMAGVVVGDASPHNLNRAGRSGA
eukprot:12909612-Prorocentrum_lima.AAC.1